MTKQYLLTLLALTTLAGATTAQTADTTAPGKTDTLKVGKFVIITTDKQGSQEPADTSKKRKFDISIGSSKRNNDKSVNTNWFILDIGFAGLRDETNYATAFSTRPGYYPRPGSAKPIGQNDFDLRRGKTTNVNLWIFMQKLNLHKHKLNLKYGLGYEMYNIRYDSRISYRDEPGNFIFQDTIGFKKNKLFVGYATVPLMLNFQPKPDNRRAFSASIGLSAGYLIGSRNKQVSNERGKEKYRDDFNLQPFRLAAIGELGLGPVRLYGSYSFNALHDEARTGLSQFPYVVGIRFSNW